MDTIANPVWIPLSQWAKAKGLGQDWATRLAKRQKIRVGAANAARLIAGVWFVREDAERVPKRPPGPPKGFRAFKRRLVALPPPYPGWPGPYIKPSGHQGENDAKSA